MKKLSEIKKIGDSFKNNNTKLLFYIFVGFVFIFIFVIPSIKGLINTNISTTNTNNSFSNKITNSGKIGNINNIRGEKVTINNGVGEKQIQEIKKTTSSIEEKISIINKQIDLLTSSNVNNAKIIANKIQEIKNENINKGKQLETKLISKLSSIRENIIKSKKRNNNIGYLGFNYIQLGDKNLNNYIVIDVNPNDIAYTYGIKKGDIIKNITNANGEYIKLDNLKVGEKINFVIQRDNGDIIKIKNYPVIGFPIYEKKIESKDFITKNNYEFYISKIIYDGNNLKVYAHFTNNTSIKQKIENFFNLFVLKFIPTNSIIYNKKNGLENLKVLTLVYNFYGNNGSDINLICKGYGNNNYPCLEEYSVLGPERIYYKSKNKHIKKYNITLKPFENRDYKILDINGIPYKFLLKGFLIGFAFIEEEKGGWGIKDHYKILNLRDKDISKPLYYTIQF